MYEFSLLHLCPIRSWRAIDQSVSCCHDLNTHLFASGPKILSIVWRSLLSYIERLTALVSYIKEAWPLGSGETKVEMKAKKKHKAQVNNQETSN